MRILLALCVMSAVAAAAPASPFDELVRRSETAFIGELTASTSPIAFKVTRTLRGKAPATAKFDFDPKLQGDLPKGVTKYLVISQGDDHWGKPTTTATLGQGIEGQISFRGWIVFPVVNGELQGGAMMFVGNKAVAVKLTDVPKILARSPYKPKG